MASITSPTYTQIDLRINDIGRLDAELGAAYQELVEQLDFAGGLNERRGQVILTGLTAMIAALQDTH